MAQSETICPYCGVGCRLQVDGNPATELRIRGVADAPANLGRICAKGLLLGETINTPDRLIRPQIRRARRDDFQDADWPTALRYAAEVFRNILNTHGPDAVAFYGSGQLDSEAAYLVGKLFKGTIGTNNTDSNSRLCMAAAVAGYRTSLGSDGPPPCYDDIDHADVILVGRQQHGRGAPGHVRPDSDGEKGEAEPAAGRRSTRAARRRPTLRICTSPSPPAATSPC